MHKEFIFSSLLHLLENDFLPPDNQVTLGSQQSNTSL